jgi:serine/threonine-protein kinase
VTTGAVFAKRYKLIRRISAGGMAEVYEVEHLGTRRRLALKVLLPEVMADAASVERFHREASVCANIDSDHVVNVIDTDVDADTGMPFLVMELLNGKDLAQYIAETWGRSVPIPPSLVLTIMRQVASALDKVHAAGIVHRDLKPANLFLTFPSEGSPRVKILDFGVAKVTHEKRASNAARLGTPLYMTSEQLTGSTVPTAATDVWALALITYELLVGVPYWDGNTAASLLERIPDAAQHPTPSTLAAARGVKLGPGFDRWLLRCIDPTPAARPATAGEAVGDLLRLFDPSATQPPTRSAAPAAPPPRELTDTHRESQQTVQTPAATRHALRATPSAAQRPQRAPVLVPTGQRAPGLTPSPPPAPEAADTPVEGTERPTIPNTGRQVVSRVRPAAQKPQTGPVAAAGERPVAAPTRQNAGRLRDPAEAKTIKMPTVRTHEAPRPGEGVRVGPMDTVPIPLARPASHGGLGDGMRHGPMETKPIPLERPILPAPPAEHAPYTMPLRPPKVATPPQPAPVAAAHPALGSSPPAASTSTAPLASTPPADRKGTPARPSPAPLVDNLLAQRISEAADESESASSVMARRRPDAHALTAMLPVVTVKPAQGVSMTTIAIAGALSLGLTLAAGYVLLHRRLAASEPAPPAAEPVAQGLAPAERAALRACAARWSPALLTRQNPDGGFGASGNAPTTGLDTGVAFVALLRGHVTGAVVAPERQLQVLRALVGARLARGWSPSSEAPAQRQATATATAWAAIAYSLMAQESRAETARARVRIARDALVAAQRSDGSFADDMAPGAARASDAASVLAAWALVEAKRADPATDNAAARGRATGWLTRQVSASAFPTGLDALAWWTLSQARAHDPAPDAAFAAATTTFARTLIARCPADRGCPAGVASWEPWTALSLQALLRAPPTDLGAPTRAALASLLSLTLARFSRAREAVAAAPAPALAPWLFAAAELQR